MRLPLIGLLALGALAVPASAAGTTDDARRAAAKIDEFIAATYARHKVTPAAPASDAAFLRRVSLDIVGKTPPVNDVRKFLADTAPEKRARAVQKLLDSPGYANHFANIWRELLIPEANADFERRFLIPGMDRWLRGHFAANTPYDKMVRELVAMPIGNQRDQQRIYNFYDNQNASPAPFYFAKNSKPDELAAGVSRLFLGVRLECAQCHDHPFGKWKREEFWSQAAFFAGFKPPRGDVFRGPLTEVSDRRELTIPNTERVAQARFLDGNQPRWKFKVSARTTLAEWMTAKNNPFFARAMVNRMWAHFFGVGIVDPVDDLVDDNPPSHPELLNYLARAFAENDYDIKFLIKAIVLSRTYQLSSTSGPGRPTELRHFARMPVKGLTAEQLFDSLSQATGHRDLTPLQNRIYDFQSLRATFMDRFGDQEKKTEHHTSIPHALTMMNNQLITQGTDPDRGIVLGAVVAAPFLDDAGKIEALFLAALSRKPTAEEAKKLLAYVEKGGATGAKKKAFADVFWALLNSTEFMFNH